MFIVKVTLKAAKVFRLHANKKENSSHRVLSLIKIKPDFVGCVVKTN